MTLKEAFAVILTAEPDTDLICHVDHLCPKPIAHDLAHCALGEQQVYTDEDAENDTAEALRARVQRADRWPAP